MIPQKIRFDVGLWIPGYAKALSSIKIPTYPKGPTGGFCGNQVKIDHEDGEKEPTGTSTIYR